MRRSATALRRFRANLGIRLVAGAAAVLSWAFWSAQSGAAYADESSVDPAPSAAQSGPVEANPGEAGEAPRPSEKRIGRAIRIRLPVTGPSASRIRQFVLNAMDAAELLGARPVLIFQFEVAPDQTEFAARSEFGACYELADFLSSERLSKATTVAVVPRTVQGHAVLVVLACEQIFMGPEAELGPAGVHQRRVTPPVLSAYQEIAARHNVIPTEVAMKLVDAGRKVFQVETEIDRRYVSPEGLQQLRKERTLRAEPRVLFEAGQPGRLSGKEARQLDFVQYLASDLEEVLRVLELPRAAVEEETLLGGQWRPVRVDVKGPIVGDTPGRVQRLIEEAIRRDNANFVCVWIDSAGGSPTDSLRLATFLAEDLDRSVVRTVAYVPQQARSDAALVALACDQLVMHPNAILGGEGDAVLSANDHEVLRQTIRGSLAPQKGRSWSLVSAMFDPELTVYRVTRRDSPYVEYFCDEELAELRDAKQWDKGPAVTQPGRPLALDGKRAVEYGLANETVSSFAEFRQLYGLENDPTLLEPGWVDALVELLATPWVAVLLLMIGGVALYGELQAPGIGVGGFLALVCFTLFFWSRLGGTADWLEVTLFVIGLVCLVLELLVLPGFGIFGLGGGALIILSLILASQTFYLPRNSYQFAQLQQSLLVVGAAAVGILVAASLLNHWLPRVPILRGLLLPPPSNHEVEMHQRRGALTNFDTSLVGAKGTTVTPLLPTGKARFGDKLLDIMAYDAEAIERGVEVEVVEVRGTRILVRPVKETT